MKLSCFRGGGGGVVGLNEIKATQPNLALAWPGLSLAINKKTFISKSKKVILFLILSQNLFCMWWCTIYMNIMTVHSKTR